MEEIRIFGEDFRTLSHHKGAEPVFINGKCLIRLLADYSDKISILAQSEGITTTEPLRISRRIRRSANRIRHSARRKSIASRKIREMIIGSVCNEQAGQLIRQIERAVGNGAKISFRVGCGDLSIESRNKSDLENINDVLFKNHQLANFVLLAAMSLAHAGIVATQVICVALAAQVSRECDDQSKCPCFVTALEIPCSLSFEDGKRICASALECIEFLRHCVWKITNTCIMLLCTSPEEHVDLVELYGENVPGLKEWLEEFRFQIRTSPFQSVLTSNGKSFRSADRYLFYICTFDHELNELVVPQFQDYLRHCGQCCTLFDATGFEPFKQSELSIMARLARLTGLSVAHLYLEDDFQHMTITDAVLSHINSFKRRRKDYSSWYDYLLAVGFHSTFLVAQLVPQEDFLLHMSSEQVLEMLLINALFELGIKNDCISSVDAFPTQFSSEARGEFFQCDGFTPSLIKQNGNAPVGDLLTVLRGRIDHRDAFNFYYHGTNWSSALSILRDGIDLEDARADSDFGKGFYVGNSFQLAASWAKNRIQPAVCIFAVPHDWEHGRGRPTRIFGSTDGEWQEWREWVFGFRAVDRGFIRANGAIECIYGPILENVDVDQDQFEPIGLGREQQVVPMQLAIKTSLLCDEMSGFLCGIWIFPEQS